MLSLEPRRQSEQRKLQRKLQRNRNPVIQSQHPNNEKHQKHQHINNVHQRSPHGWLRLPLFSTTQWKQLSREVSSVMLWLAVEQNRRVMYVAIKTMKYLATDMTAVLGHSSQDASFCNCLESLLNLIIMHQDICSISMKCVSGKHGESQK